MAEPSPAKPDDPSVPLSESARAAAKQAAQAPAGPAPASGARPQAPSGFFKLRGEISTLGRMSAGGLFLLLLLVAWTLVTRGKAEERMVSPAMLGSPMETLLSFKSLWFDRALTRNLLASLWRVLQGFGLA
ncbi:MAG: hypothetical protein HY901_02525, partial [Deltaproteobacteria bacterium]|nr:hypothetical protein [Deltaproteobacteria bacterium]